MATNEGGSIMMREYRKGNWSLTETMILIEAKRMDDERRMKRSSDPTESRSKPAELRWKWVEDYCWRKGCLRSQNQCNDKWDNLMRDYKKVRDYERRITSGEGGLVSYWKLEKTERKERSLPSNMVAQVYEGLVDIVERGRGHSSLIASFVPTTIPPAAAAIVSNTSSYVLETPHRQHPLSIFMQSQPLPSPFPPAAATPQPMSQSPPPTIPLHQAPSPTVDSDTSHDQFSDSPAKRRKTTGGGGGGGEGTSGTGISDFHEVGSAISRSATMIAEAIHACEESEERRHRELLSMHERRLKMEESKTEVDREGINGLVDAINNLAGSILALARNKNQASPK